jgi:hypothetical protein
MVHRKVRLSLALIVCATLHCKAQHPTWDWAKCGIASGESVNADVLVSSSGNVYVSGTFSGSLKLGAFSLLSHGKKDAYIAKYDPLGNTIWAKSLGGDKDDLSSGVVEDLAGNIYYTGYYTDSADMDAHKLLSYGGEDVFLIKLDADGKVIWSKTEGGAYNDNAGPNSAIAIDKKGNVITTGVFGIGGSLPAASADFGGHMLYSSGSNAMFLVKHDSAGNVIWARKAGDVQSVLATDVQCDAMNNCYVLGGFGNRMYFDSKKIIAGGSAISNMFLAKYDSAGMIQWVKTGSGYTISGGSGSDFIALSLAVDSLGNSVAIGTTFNCDVMFDAYGARGRGHNDDIFMVKFDSSGNALWAKGIGGDGFDYGNAVCMDKQSNIYITGTVGAGAVIGDTILGSNQIIYVAKYNPNGDALWAVTGDGDGDEQGNGIGLDLNGTVYIVGDFKSSSTWFGAHTIINATTSRTQFLAKLNTHTTGIYPSKMPSTCIFPNPVRDVFYVRQTDGLRYKQLTIFDISGRVVITKELSADHVQAISVSSITNGVYFLRFTEQAGASETKRIVISH